MTDLELYTDVYEGISFCYSVAGIGKPIILIPGTLGDEQLFISNPCGAWWERYFPGI